MIWDLVEPFRPLHLLVPLRSGKLPAPNAPHPPWLIANRKSEISKDAQDGALKAKIYHGPLITYYLRTTSYKAISSSLATILSPNNLSKQIPLHHAFPKSIGIG
ncbi:hypothetical protein O181_029745 [Austropuccinia psidii MF-1]|uniref:Uncharacterized protein n=1 Tax=Austropuccinia psidii MF-1 TaxID=1389203 RepID=A0A9Q3H5H7_9BASI|nr:hypothetical protein [Austropuccinia psidii MF-1]